MTATDLAAALARAARLFTRCPDLGLGPDTVATAKWAGGTRMLTGDGEGREVATDVPAALGGAGGEVTPGWLLRAGLASCTATCIVMAAAAEGVELSALEVRVDSRSDVRGLLLLTGAGGEAVHPGPGDMVMTVRVAAPDVAAPRLAALVESGRRRSSVLAAVEDAMPVELRIETVAG